MADGSLRVFVSYTAQDLTAHAEVVSTAIRKMGWVAVDHRDWAASGEPSLAWCREQVESCDALVVLSAHRYGWVPRVEEGGDGEQSVVWWEYAAARERRIPVLPFLVVDDAPWNPKLIEATTDPVAGERLTRLQKVLRQAICGSFSTPSSLEAPALQALMGLKERLARTAPTTGVCSGAVTGYLGRVVADNRLIDLIGLGDRVQVSLPVDEAYVTLRASLPMALGPGEEAGLFRTEDLERCADLERDVPVPEIFARAASRGLRGVALVGEPGCGKSTAARHIAWRCADPSQGPASLGLPEGTVPALLRLRRLRPERMEQGLQGFLVQEISSPHLSDSPDLGAQLWRHSRLLWILDGLDEVVDPATRARVSRWIDEAARVRPDDWFLVTCRHSGYRGDAVLGAAFLEMHVQPLDPGQRAEYVTRWYLAVERRLRGVGPEAERRAREQAAGLIRLLETGDFRVQTGLAALAANPLILAILCVVFRQEADLPRRRAELYARCVDVLLHHWRAAKEMEGLSVPAARAVLEPLAWWMHGEDGRTEAGATELAGRAEAMVSRLGKEAPAPDGASFLQRACDQAGILVRPGPGTYAFLHLSFQEYLAATHAVQEPGLGVFLGERFGESWWKETTLLALGQGKETFSSAFFQTALARAEVDPGFFALCVDDALLAPVDVLVSALRGERPSWWDRLLGRRGFETTSTKQALILRVLAGRRDPALLDAARGLVGSADEMVARAAREVLLRAGAGVQESTERIEERTGIVLVRVPAGTGWIGSTLEEQDQAILEASRGADRVLVEQVIRSEGPRHEVRLTAAFLMGRHPVTCEQYGRFLAAHPERPKPRFWDEPRLNQPRQPVVGVNWEDAAAFCRWAGGRLPGELEWEYACRAGTTTRYWSGDDVADLERVGWYEANSGHEPHAVGQKPENPWGLCDMHGNVWEWTADPWTDDYEGTVREIDPGAILDAPVGALRVVRGGSAWYGPERCRAASRDGGHPKGRGPGRGFRLVVPLPGGTGRP